MGARIRLKEDKCDKTWVHPQTRVIIEALCTHGGIVIDSSDKFSLNVESSNKWSESADEELMQLHLQDFDYVNTESLATVDTNLLWQTAFVYSFFEFGPFAPLGGGWYEGSFWSTLLRDGKLVAIPAAGAPPGVALRSVVDSPNWLQSRPTPRPD
jgi:hypothetical protein